MKKFIPLTILIFMLSSTLVHSQEIDISERAKKDIVTKVATIIQSTYVFEDLASKMSQHILSQYKNGEYTSLKDTIGLCKKLTSDLRSINNDKHLYVFYSPEEAYEVRAYKKLLPEEEILKINADIYEIERKENFGFKKLEILQGNIGYLKLDYFASPKFFEEKLVGVMNFLSNSDAIIIDLRDNGGGEGSSLLASYFLSQNEMLLGASYCRDSANNTYSRTIKNIPGKRLADIELLILTNSRTFSAAESFAYDMKHLKRGIVVGERTKGGAHPVDVLIVSGNILTQIPICESYNPITKTNWEGIGVKPDIESPSEDALNAAYIIALEKIIAKTSDIEYQAELQSILDEIRDDEFRNKDQSII